MKLLTSKDEGNLLRANLGDKTGMNIPDAHPAFSQEQRNITEAYKKAWGVEGVEYTFRLAVVKGELNVYSPSIITKDNKLVVEWGGKTFPLPETANFDSSSCSMLIVDGDEDYSLKVRLRYFEKAEDCQTPLQKQYFSAKDSEKGAILNKAFLKGNLQELVSQGFTPALKLADIGAGEYQVKGYKLTTGKFGNKYQLLLTDGRWLNANTALHSTIVAFEEEGVDISADKPATLIVQPSTKQVNGHPVYPTRLLSWDSQQLPVFDFGGFDLVELGTSDKAVAVEVEVIHF